MADFSAHALKALPPKSHLAAIGAIAAIWTLIESGMELTICGLYEIDLGRGLMLTTNLSFHSRLSLLRILTNGGAVKDPALKQEMIELLNRIDQAYGVRNHMVHGLWSKTDQPGKARRLSLRARGKRLVTEGADFTADDLWRAFGELAEIKVRFVDLGDRLGVPSKLQEAPRHSTVRT